MRHYRVYNNRAEADVQDIFALYKLFDRFALLPSFPLQIQLDGLFLPIYWLEIAESDLLQSLQLLVFIRHVCLYGINRREYINDLFEFQIASFLVFSIDRSEIKARLENQPHQRIADLNFGRRERFRRLQARSLARLLVKFC